MKKLFLIFHIIIVEMKKSISMKCKKIIILFSKTNKQVNNKECTIRITFLLNTTTPSLISTSITIAC